MVNLNQRRYTHSTHLEVQFSLFSRLVRQLQTWFIQNHQAVLIRCWLHNIYNRQTGLDLSKTVHQSGTTSIGGVSSSSSIRRARM